MAAAAKPTRRRKCKYEKALRTLVDQNQQFMRWLDVEMVKPTSATRGHRIAQALNALGMAVDHVRYFTLGVDYRKDRNPTFGRKGDR
jgi:valyl-tRNA synthetase